MSSFKADQVIRIIFKVEYSNNSTRSFSQAIDITYDLKFQERLSNQIKGYIQLNSEHYDDLTVTKIIFEYLIYNKVLSHQKFKFLQDFIETDFISIPLQSGDGQPFFLSPEGGINDYSFLPKTMDL